MTHTCPEHGNPITAGVYDDTTCSLPACWARFGLPAPKAKPTAVARKPLATVCPHLDPAEVRLGQRTWRRCLAGRGSTHPAAVGLVCRCGTPDPGGLIWRQGHECGPRCPGYPPSADAPAGGPTPTLETT